MKLTVCEEIKNKIQEKGLKLNFVAEQVKIPIKNLSYKLLKNSLKLDELFKLAKFLNINLNKFKEA